MKKIFSLLLSATLLSSMFVGCSAKPAATPEQTTKVEEKKEEVKTEEKKEEAPVAEKEKPQEKVKMKVAYHPNMGGCSAIITGIKKGYFEEQGIDVELVQFTKGPEEVAAMGSGNIDVGYIGHGAHALCAEGQVKVFALDCTSLADEVIGNADKGVNSIADLKGKKIATSLGTSSEIILNLALASEGMTQDDVEIVQMDASGAVTAMVTGKVDACAIWSPSTVTVKKQLGDKAVMLANNNTYRDEMVFPSSWVVTEKYAKENPELLVRFTKALYKSMDYRAENIEEVAGWVAETIAQDKAVILETINEGDWLTSEFVSTSAKDGTLKKWYENQQKEFVRSGRLPAAVDVDTYVLYDVMLDAYEGK